MILETLSFIFFHCRLLTEGFLKELRKALIPSTPSTHTEAQNASITQFVIDIHPSKTALSQVVDDESLESDSVYLKLEVAVVLDNDVEHLLQLQAEAIDVESN